MGYIILGFIAFSIFLALMTYWINQITAKYVTRILNVRFTSLEQIVNDKRIPDAWLGPFREKLVKVRANGANDTQLSRLGQKAQQRCLTKVEGLIKYATEVNFTDTRATKAVIIKELKAQRDVWETMDWQAWIAVLDAPEAPPKTEDESSEEDVSLSPNA